MKLPCPYCSQSLNLPDRFAGKVTKCPACQQSFQVPALEVPAEAAGNAAPAAAAAAKPHSEEPVARLASDADPADDLALHTLMEREDAPRGPESLTVCPKCATPWKKDAIECAKCQYNVFVGGKLRRPPKRSMNLNFDIQKLFLLAFIAALCYGGYWMYNNFGKVRRQGDKFFDDAAKGHIEDTQKAADDEAEKLAPKR
ncbi:MAG TPA: hypothetical protein VEK08_05310 [Planctomycetota bacterium]|nr:hypothetical protein [Planctomycetota bacterium]